MKHLLTLVTLFGLILFFSTNNVSAQSANSDLDQAVKVGPFGFIIGSYNATYEKRLTDQSSFVVGGRFLSYSLSELDYTAFSVNGQYRKYFKEAIAGPYVAPSASVGFNSSDALDGSFTSIGVGADIGWQWIAGGGFVVDLGLGVRYRNGFGDEVDVTFSGIGPAFQVQIGYAF